MSSFDTFSLEPEANTHGGYTGFTSGGGDDYIGTGHFSAEPPGVFHGEGDVSVDHVAVSPESFGFEDRTSGYYQPPYGSVPVENGNGNGGFFESDDGVFTSDGPMLPPLSEMEPEEGYALREWRR